MAKKAVSQKAPARADALAKRVSARDAANRSDRSSFETLWQEIARYVIPVEATFNETTSQGVERGRSILDSTAPRALERFAAFIHTLMNNPSAKWFKLEPLVADRKTLDIPRVKKWVEDTEAVMASAMNAPKSNVYNTLFATYLGLGAFGTSVFYTDAPDGKLRTQSFHMDDVTIEEDFSGNVDAVFRRRKYTLRQAKQRWPTLDAEDLGPSFVKKGEDKGKTEAVMMHCVVPTDDMDIMGVMKAKDRALVEDAPFVGIWINATDNVTISVTRFEEQPYTTPRWYKARGETYGRSPAMTVLPNIRMVNRMKETIIRGGEKLVDPPLILPDGSLVSPIRLFPGGISFSEGNVKPEALIPPGASRVEYGQNLLELERQDIKDGFFIPLFVTPDSPVKTATEVLQQTDERNRALSPMLVRQRSETFHSFIARVYGVLFRAGKLPVPPPELEDIPMEIKYISPLDASQQQVEALGTMRIFEGLQSWAQLDPSVFDSFEPDDVARVVHAGSGAPASVLRDKAKVVQIRKAKGELAQQQAQQAGIIDAAEAGAKVVTAGAAATKASRA